MSTLIHMIALLDRFANDSNDKDYDRAVTYCNNIMDSCPASSNYAAMKCEYLLRALRLKDAKDFSAELMKNPDMKDVPLIKCWRARITIYAGQENAGKQQLQDVLREDPDMTDAMRTLKALKAAAAKKEEASQIFKNNQFEQAIAAFEECIALDPLNLTFNSTVYLNKAICQVKLGKNEEALTTLNICLKMVPDYAKALVKRGEVHQNLEDWEDAVHDYSAA